MRRGIDFRETSSWKLYRFAQVETKFVRIGPLRVVWRRRLDHVRLIVLINREPGRSGKIAKIVHDHFLLLRVEQIETAQKKTVDGELSGSRSGTRRDCGKRGRFRTRHARPGGVQRH